MPSKLVFFIGDYFSDTDFSLIQELQNKYQIAEYEIAVFSILTDENKYQKSVAFTRENNWNTHRILFDNSVTVAHSNKEKISLATEHKFIDLCLKAIQIEKPDNIILYNKPDSKMTAAIKRNILAHAEEVGCAIETI